MCGQIAGLIVAGLSAAASGYGAYQRNEAMQDAQERRQQARMNALMRQSELDDQRQQDYQDMLAKTAGRDKLEAQQSEAEQRRLDAINNLRQNTAEERLDESLSPQSATDSPASKTNNVVKQNLEARRGVLDTDMAQRAQALAELSGLGDALQAIGRERQKYYEDLQNNKSFARANANRLDLAVNTIRPDIDPTASIIGGLGGAIAGAASRNYGYNKGLNSSASGTGDMNLAGYGDDFTFGQAGSNWPRTGGFNTRVNF